MVKAIIEAGANVNYTTSDGDSALLKACENGDIEITKLLIDAGANVAQINSVSHNCISV